MFFFTTNSTTTPSMPNHTQAASINWFSLLLNTIGNYLMLIANAVTRMQPQKTSAAVISGLTRTFM